MADISRTTFSNTSFELTRDNRYDIFRDYITALNNEVIDFCIP